MASNIFILSFFVIKTIHGRIKRGVGQGSVPPPPPEKSQNIGFLVNTGPDPLKKHKAKIRNQYNQAPHLTQDTNGKVTTLQLDITNKSQ